MASAINLPYEQLAVRRSVSRHVALEFYRGDRWSEYLAFEPAGLQRFRVRTSTMEKDFPEAFSAGEHPEFFVSAVLSFVSSLRRAYIPGDSVADILTEVYSMATTKGTADLGGMKLDELTAHYNSLAKAAGKPELKMFKSKAEALKRIEVLHSEVAKATPQQKANKEKAGAEAAKRLAGLASLETSKKEKTEAKAKVEKPPKPSAKVLAKPKPAAKKADGEKKPRGQGIGAFCSELILKGKTNEDVLAAVKTKFPDASTSASSVAWYRNKLKSEGKLAA